MDKSKAVNLNPIVLAFVGDAVYSLFVREKLTFNNDSKAGALNLLAIKEVRATAQARFLDEISELFTEDEMAVFKRGRNAKKGTRAKSATVAEYNASTGFEAVLGYLYLTGNTERLNYLLNKGKTNED
ncbi:MAG: Mini-ribonuclease 3 [Clostridia bacterium]|nr:Mini-ribonuclease 3 [Clostridia bacterium]